VKAQVYDDDFMCRVFDRGGNGICDVWGRTSQPTLGEIDEALKRIRMRRVGNWKRYREGGFYEASVRFDTPRKSPPKGKHIE
jgi:hypothetical protein